MFSTKKQADIFSNKLFAYADKKKVKFKFSSEKLLKYNEGDIVFKKGDKTNHIYLIMEGEIKIKIPNPPFAPKIQFKYRNDFFGEKELLEKSERKSSCVTEKNCQLYPITYNELQKLILESTVVKDNLEMVTISTIGKTIKEITKESTGDKKTEEKIDYQKAIKTHPEEPIPTSSTDNIKKAEITLENIFKNGEKETKKDIFIDETDNTKQNTLSDINITEELRKKKDIVEPLSEKTIEEHKTTEKEKPAIITNDANQDLQSQDITEEVEPKEEKISDEKYNQIIDAGLSLLKIINIDELTQEIVKQVTELVKTDRSILFFVNKDDKMLEAKISTDDNEKTDLKIPLNDSISGLCALRNKIVIIDDVSKDDRFNTIYDEVFNYKTKNLLVVPIADKDENVVAVLELINSRDETFTEIDIEILKIFIKSILLSLSNCTKTEHLITTANKEALTNISKYIYRDIKSPLLTIKNYAKILIKDKLPKEIKQVLELIIMQTDFVDSLNDNLSTFYEDKESLSLEEVSIKEVANDILDLLAEYAESRNVVLYKKIDVETKVNLDSKQLTIVFYQIIKNACDAQPNKGSVYITSTLIDGTVNIEFKDSGEGVPVYSQTEIFKNFTSFKSDEHLGIGLNIADKIVKAHGGNLTVSNSSDGGAIFTISLPAVK
ncbi:MAG: GAF domain-containing protein [Bacteroidetes bacterium]|nr:GAF domain-containing protein [Bacteroidota bacterium]MCH8325446.1 GAF domain-containing protein [Bacteroidota bacterium]